MDCVSTSSMCCAEGPRHLVCSEKPISISMGRCSSSWARAAVPLVEFGGVGQVGFANQDAVAGIGGDHRAHAADDVVDFGKIVGIDVVEVGVAMSIGAAQFFRRAVEDLRRGLGWRRDGSRRHRGRARSAWRRTWPFPPRDCASSGPAAACRTHGSRTGATAGTHSQAEPPKSETQLLGGTT